MANNLDRNMNADNDKNENKTSKARNQNIEDPICRVYWQVSIEYKNLDMFWYIDRLHCKLFLSSNICLQIFVTFAINLSALPIGTNISLTGILLSRLRESENDIQLTKDEESWFGNEINLNIPDENYNIQ